MKKSRLTTYGELYKPNFAKIKYSVLPFPLSSCEKITRAKISNDLILA